MTMLDRASTTFGERIGTLVPNVTMYHCLAPLIHRLTRVGRSHKRIGNDAMRVLGGGRACRNSIEVRAGQAELADFAPDIRNSPRDGDYSCAGDASVGQLRRAGVSSVRTGQKGVHHTGTLVTQPERDIPAMAN